MTASYLYKDNTFTLQTQTLSPAGNITVQAGAYILPPGGDDGFDLDTGQWTIKLDGAIQSDGAGISMLESSLAKNSHLTIGATGSIYDQSGYGVFTKQALDVANSGLIHGAVYGIRAAAPVAPTASKGFTIDNKATGTIEGDSTAIYSTNDDWTLTVKNAGTISGATSAIEWAGAAVITNTGRIEGDLAATSNTGTFAASLTNSGLIFGDVSLSDGDDIVKNTGKIGGTLKFFDGVTNLTNSGEITGVAFGSGKTIVTNSGDIFSAITFDLADDTLKNTGKIYDTVTLGNGANTLTNGGTILSDVIGGDQTDVVKNAGTVDGMVSLGDGDDNVTNSGTIKGDVLTGSGNDVFKNTGTVGGAGTIDLGIGNDTFIGGNDSEYVFDNFGSDTYKFGGGNDIFICEGQGFFTLDGGAGYDAFYAQVALGYTINLDSKAVSLLGNSLAANSAFLTGLPIGGSIKGFEEADGGSASDVIAGDSAANSLHGNGGSDVIAGGLGADKLYGGAGDDTFIWLQAKDSGNTQATRDTIKDLEGAGVVGGDILDLQGVDANTKLADDQAFTFIGANTAFNHVAGELRAVTEGGNTILQGDCNGDGKADFTIEVIGAQTFVATDFTL